MSTLRFYRTNLLTQSFAVLKNGTGGGAPALEEHADFPMTNLLVGDRYSYWKSAGTAGFDVDFDLGSTKAIKALGVTALDPLQTVGAVEIFTAGGSTYPPTWTSQGTISPLSSVDSFIAANLIHRFVRFEFTSLSAAIRAKLWAAQSVSDVGHGGSPGFTEERRKARIRAIAPGGQPVVTVLGPDRTVFSIPLNVVPSAVQSILSTLVAESGSFILGTVDDRWFEVIVAEDRLAWSTLFDGGSAPLYDAVAVFENLP